MVQYEAAGNDYFKVVIDNDKDLWSIKGHTGLRLSNGLVHRTHLPLLSPCPDLDAGPDRTRPGQLPADCPELPGGFCARALGHRCQ